MKGKPEACPCRPVPPASKIPGTPPKEKMRTLTEKMHTSRKKVPEGPKDSLGGSLWGDTSLKKQRTLVKKTDY